MSTAKKWLEDLGFDAANGRILLRWSPKNESGYDDRSSWGENSKDLRNEYVTLDHPRMIQEFSDGFGGNQSPHFIAEDKDFLYIVGTYDGSSWLNKVAKNIDHYKDSEDLPCIGGG